LDDEWSKTDKGCKETKASLNKKLVANDAAMKQLDMSIARLKGEIAQHREDLVIADGQLKDDELYLKDLTASCEARANDFDQRSAMRGDELDALRSALKVLRNDVQDQTKVNKRAMLVQESAAAESTDETAIPWVLEATLKSISFLQGSSSSGRSRTFLGLSQEDRKGKALDVLRKEGDRIGSVALTALAERVAGDPFKKIKGLIQKLIERLLTESKNEATKKGFCDTELAKSRKDRDFRFQESNDLSADLERLEAKRDELTEEISQLKKSITAETLALKEATESRKDEKEANEETLRVAKEGFEGINNALLILRSFYKQAAKAAFVQASPVDEDAPPVASGNYKGKQGGMKAVFALLETIVSDFDRTLRKTEEAENAAHREFVAFSQASEASIAGKTTKKELDEEDLATTKTSIKTKMDDLQTAVNLLDKALQELEELKDTCIDTGMSYSQRVQKRQEEMEALTKALCILDEEKVETECRP